MLCLIFYVCANEVVKASPHSRSVIFQLPHAPNHQLPLGVVIGGLACVVIEKLPTTRKVMLYNPRFDTCNNLSLLC